MSNRQQPTRPQLSLLVVRIVKAEAALADLSAFECSECDSTVAKLQGYEANLLRLEIRHDSTCPWLQKRGRPA